MNNFNATEISTLNLAIHLLNLAIQMSCVYNTVYISCLTIQTVHIFIIIIILGYIIHTNKNKYGIQPNIIIMLR